MNRFNGNELKYVEEVLNSNMKSATSGTFTERLEKAFASKFNCKYAIAHNSGTSALHTAMLALGIKAGDEVITPALTVAMDGFAIKYVGARPIYADVKPDTLTIDPECIEYLITDKTKAIIAVHLYGNPCDMNSIMDIAKKHNICVIEDCAQSFLSKYKEKLCGSIGHISIFSFENSKHISTGEGGISLTNSENLAVKIRKYAGIGYANLTAESGRIRSNEDVFQDPKFIRHDTIGYNFRMPELCSAVALAQLERLEDIVKNRQIIASMYRYAIRDCPYLLEQRTTPNSINSYWAFTVKYHGDIITGKTWQDFRKAYIRNGGDGFYGAWQLSYNEPALRDQTSLCPTAELIQPRIMQFKTNYQDLDIAQKKADALEKTIRELS